MKTTISHIKADIGSLPGHTTVHEDVVAAVKKHVKFTCLNLNFSSREGNLEVISVISRDGNTAPVV